MLRARVFWLFVLTGSAELVALLALHESDISSGAIVVLGLFVLWLGSGSRSAWWLFVAGNGLVLVCTLALTVGSGSGAGASKTEWGDVIVLSLGSTALLMILLSTSMRGRFREVANG